MKNSKLLQSTIWLSVLLCALGLSQLKAQTANFDLKFMGLECVNHTDAGASSEIGYVIKAYLKDQSGTAYRPFLEEVWGSKTQNFEIGNGQKKDLRGFKNFDMDLSQMKLVLDVTITEYDDFGGDDIFKGNMIETRLNAKHVLSMDVRHSDGDHFRLWYALIKKSQSGSASTTASGGSSGASGGSSSGNPASLEEALKPENYNKAKVEELLAKSTTQVSAAALTAVIVRKDYELFNDMLAKDKNALTPAHFSKAMEVGRKDIAKRILSTKMITPGEQELIMVIDAGDFMMLNEMIDLYGGQANAKVLNHAIQKQAGSSVTKLLRQVKPNAESFEIAARLNDDMLYGDLTMEGRIPNNRSIEIAIDNNNKTIMKDGIANGGDANKALDYALAKKNKQAINYLVTRKDVEKNKALKYAIDTKDKSLWDNLLNNLDADANQALDLAVAANNTEMAVVSLETGKTSPSKHLNTALKANNDALTKKLVEFGADANEGMALAITQNKTEIVELLIASGAKADKVAYVEDAAADNLTITKMLVKAGADANDGMAAAAAHKQLSTVGFLLDEGADANKGMNSAVRVGANQIVAKLLDAGASPEGFISAPAKVGNLQMVKLFVGKGIAADKGMAAAVAGNKDNVTSYLLAEGASAMGHIATASKNGNLNMVSDLLAHGAVAENGIKAAVKGGHAAVAKKLIVEGADGSNANYMLSAVIGNHAALIPVLHDAGAPVDQTMADGGSLLHKAAVLTNSLNTTTALVKLGLSLDAQNNKGNTPLHLAAAKGKEWLAIVELLASSGADVNARNHANQTPLKVAKSSKVKKALKNHGALKK